MNVGDIKNIESEAGIIASIILKPELTFYSEELRPNHFSDEQNAYVYYAVCELAKCGIEKIDAYNITNILNKRESTRKATDTLTVTVLNELIDVAKAIARDTVEEYKLLVSNVLDAAFRRDTYKRLIECERLCFNGSVDNIEQKIYSALDDVMMKFSTVNEVPQYKDVVEKYWEEILNRQNGDNMSSLPFKFETLNLYATIERSELFLFAGGPKIGKRMMLLNCAVDLLKKDQAVFYIDSELNTRMFTLRLISHLTMIEYNRLKVGRYTEEERAKIDRAIAWLKTRKFTHLYMPMFDAQSIYTAVKRVKHTQGLDVLIVDYFKSSGEGDAFDTYQELGRSIDMVKNQICGKMNIAGLGAVQTTDSGKIADSAKICRNASTIAIITEKTPEEMAEDGAECGNRKLRVIYNRNGEQMMPSEYIDLKFNGNIIRYEQAKQHIPSSPY